MILAQECDFVEATERADLKKWEDAGWTIHQQAPDLWFALCPGYGLCAGD